MTPQEKAQLDAQIKEIQDNTKKSENRNGKITLWAIGLATVLGIGNVAQGIAIKGLTPLKQPVPMIAVIDSETGIMTNVEKFDSTTDPKLIEKLVTSYFWDTISSRYGYYGRVGKDQLSAQYAKASIFLDGKDRSDFENEVSGLNQNSPYNLLGETGSITPKVISVNFLGNNKVQASFKTTVLKGTEIRQYSYTITADYITDDFNDLNVKDRWINPFGVKFKNWNLTQNSSNDALVTQNTAVQQLPNAQVNQNSDSEAVAQTSN